MSEKIHDADLKAFQDAISAVNSATAVFDAFRNFIVQKYGLAEGDSINNVTGVITKAKPIVVAVAKKKGAKR